MSIGPTDCSFWDKMISRPYFGSKNNGFFFYREHDVNGPIERLCRGHDAFRGGSANMILFNSVGHGRDRVDPAGLSDPRRRVGRSCPSSFSLAGEGRAILPRSRLVRQAIPVQ